MEAWVLSITVVLSTASAALATYRLNIGKERLSFRARKAEEVYCTTEMLDARLSTFFERRYSLLANGGLDQSVQERSIIGADIAKLKMLVGFYFVGLSGSLSRTISAAGTSFRCLDAFERAADPAQRDYLMQELDATVVDLKDALEALKQKILEHGSNEDPTRPFKMFRKARKAVPARRIMEVPA